MEFLKRKGEASFGSIKIITDQSLSLSFHLPSNYRNPRQVSVEAPNSHQEIGQGKKSVEITSQQLNETDTTSTWETIDTWEQQINTRKNNLASSGDIDVNTTEEKWEEEKIPDLPDDFPCLLVNLTRLQKEHLQDVIDQEEPLQKVYNTIKHALYQHFSLMIEVFFEQKLCFHCTYGTINRFKKKMEAFFPKDHFALMDYPCTIEDIPLHEFLVSLSRPSRFESVEYLKDCLRRSSRDLVWKVQVLKEVEKLAEEEFEFYQSHKSMLSAEIDQLTGLRNFFQVKLENTATVISTVAQKKQQQQTYMLLRKIEDLENRLMQLLDEYLAEPPELEPHEIASNISLQTTQKNVLDMVIAMIFIRLPRDPKVSAQKHYEMLLDHHIHICRLWKKDFGRLPPSRKFPSLPQALEDNSVTTVAVDEKERNDVENWKEWVSLEEREEDYHQDEENAQIEEENRRSLCSDGYGADYEIGSEEEEENEMNDTQLECQQQEEKVEALVDKSRRNRNKKKKKKPFKSTKTKPKEPEREPQSQRSFFQPFACTSAIGSLLEAKAREQEELLFF